jgi:hypothetical protein
LAGSLFRADEVGVRGVPVLEGTHDLTATVLVGQVRSMAADLLRSTGMNQAQALVALEEVAPRPWAEP